MKVIDTHHHFWSAKSGTYSWLNINDQETLWGCPSNLPREFFPEDLIKAAENLELAKSVHLQCGYDPARPADESKLLQEMADNPDSRGFPHGIVAFADLSQPDVDSLLSQHCEYKNMRGIRQLLDFHKNPNWSQADRHFMRDEAWRKNFSLLERYKLSFDLHIYHHQIDDAISLAQANPNILVILNHAGIPADRDTESINAWRTALHRFSECDNVAAKISGLGMCDRNWTVESIRPFVVDVIEAFGVDRCMFGSNFPIDSLFSDYQTVWRAYDQITADLSDDERVKLFHDNAEKYYRI